VRRHAKAILATSAMLLTLALGVTLAGAVAPAVTIDPPSAVSYTSVHLSGTVDPQDQETSYRFQYSKDPVGEGWSNGAFQGPIAAGAGVQNVSDDLSDLEPGTEYEARLLAENIDGQTISAEPNPSFTTDPVALPSVSIDPVSSITDDGAHFQGSINPQAPGGNPDAFDVDWHFECTPTCPGLPEPQTIEADASNHVVQADASGLDPNADYEVRLVAENAGGTQTAAVGFKTSTSAPIVQALPPAVITDTSAWIGAKVNPQNSATTYYVELADNEDFEGSTQFLGSLNGDVGSGNQLVFVNHHAEGLEPAATYYYRVVAEGAGPTIGDSVSFATRALPFDEGQGLPDGRVYEKVSPADKNGGDVAPGTVCCTTGALAQASISGQAIAYGVFGNFDGEGSPVVPQYLAHRDQNGAWSTKGISPPMDPLPVLGNTLRYMWFSEDLSLGAVAAPAAINPGDPTGLKNLYLRNNITDEYQAITGANSSTPKNTQFMFHASSRNGKALVFSSNGVLWELLDGNLRQVSPQEAEVGSGPSLTDTQVLDGNPISEDGSRIYFTDGLHGVEQEGPIFLRDFNTPDATVLVSASERTGDDPSEPRDGRFEVAAPDGSRAFFLGGQLTDDSVNTFGRSLFLWDRNAPEGNQLRDLTTADPEGPDVLGVAGYSDDATSVYFAAMGKFDPAAVRGLPNLYLWRQGHGLKFIATIPGDVSVWTDEATSGSADDDGAYREARVTPDGRFIAFSTRAVLTSFDTKGLRTVYLYDSDTDKLMCVSCSLVNPSADAGSWLVSANFGESAMAANPRSAPRNLSPDAASLVFDSEDDLVPMDSNGVMDVYQWSNGEIRLISGGINAIPSVFIDASASGDDLFFTTAQQLVHADSDKLVDLYDARVGGTTQPTERAPCVGDECQGTPILPPSFATPSSSSLQGFEGNALHRPRCAKGKVRRKGRCLKRAKNQKRAKPAQGRRAN
jgi:hypothetical protein